MKKIITILIFSLTIIAITTLGAAGTYEAIQINQLTTDTHYDRNPSFFKADGTWWLFFVKSQDGDANYGAGCLGKGCDEPGCNCDGASYDVYYMTSTDDGVTWSAETKVDECSTGQRGMAAFQDDTGKIWVFVSGPGTSTIQYCTSNDNGATWSGPTDTGYTGSHVDAFQAQNGDIYIFYQSDGVQYAYSSDGGTTWTPGTVDGTDGMGIPKCMQDSSERFYCVYANWAGGMYYYSISNDGTTWINKGVLTDVPNTISCDPVMYQDSSGNYWLLYAPWDSTDNSQWIEYKTSTNARTWSAPTGLTSGGYGSKYWWDMWPEVSEGSDIIVFYTSEQNSAKTDRIDGNIWMMKLRDETKWLKDKLHIEDDHGEWLWDKVMWLQDMLFLDEKNAWIWDIIYAMQEWPGFSDFWDWFYTPECPYECCLPEEGYKVVECPEGYDCINHQCVEHVCDQGDRRCIDNTLEECQNNRWIVIEECELGCSPTNAHCIAICEDGDRRCIDNQLEECQNNRWETIQTCGWGCDPTNAHCRLEMRLWECYKECKYNSNYIQACFETYPWLNRFIGYCPPPEQLE